MDMRISRVKRLMMVLNHRLGDSEWLSGTSYSIADIATLPYVRSILTAQPGQYPHVDRWGQAMLARPAVAEALKSEDRTQPGLRTWSGDGREHS